MSTTLTPTERSRFLQSLKEDDEFRDAVRRQLLSDELLELPERFSQFTTYVNEFIASTNEFIASTKEFIASTNEFIASTKEFIASTNEFIASTNEFIASTNEFIEYQKGVNARVEERLNRIDDNIGILKGNAARRLLRDYTEEILDIFDLDFVRTLSRDDLRRMVRSSGEASGIPFGERRSFYAADLVIEGIDSTDNIHYIAAEASFTADNRDTDRAIRNAAFLTRFTGLPAIAVVASIVNDYATQELINQGGIQWFQLNERELEAD